MLWHHKHIALLLLLPVGLPSAAQENLSISLEEARYAYTEAKNVGNKADTFLHAQRAYSIGRKLYANDPAKLAPITLAYANAAATYREPLALKTYEQALDEYAKAHGSEHPDLTRPLINAAEEAISRKEPKMAYAWLARARKILKNEQLQNNFLKARMHMGLARMFKNSGQMGRAEKHASRSLDLLSEQDTSGTFPENANLYFWHGQVMRSLKLNKQARQSYLKSLALFGQQDPDARKVLSIHTHLVEINHKLGDQQSLIKNCHAVEAFENTRNSSQHYPLYDPSGIIGGYQSDRIGELVANFTVGLDCKVRNIEVLGATGIDKTKAQKFLSQVYFTPTLEFGKPKERIYEFMQLAVYDQN